MPVRENALHKRVARSASRSWVQARFGSYPCALSRALGSTAVGGWTPRRRPLAGVLLPVTATVMLTGCAGGGAARPAGAQSAGPAPTPAAFVVGRSAAPCMRAGAMRRANVTLRLARQRYRDEGAGSVIHSELRRIAHDRILLHDLRVGDLGAALTEADRQLIHHVVRIRVKLGGRLLVDANASSFSVAGAGTELRAGGRDLGRLTITIQDVIGFIKLNFRHDGAAATVVRASNGQTRTNLPAAARTALPVSGCVTVAGSRYLVRSFKATSFTGEPLTVWLLTRP